MDWDEAMERIAEHITAAEGHATRGKDAATVQGLDGRARLIGVARTLLAIAGNAYVPARDIDRLAQGVLYQASYCLNKQLDRDLYSADPAKRKRAAGSEWRRRLHGCA